MDVSNLEMFTLFLSGDINGFSLRGEFEHFGVRAFDLEASTSILGINLKGYVSSGLNELHNDIYYQLELVRPWGLLNTGIIHTDHSTRSDVRETIVKVAYGNFDLALTADDGDLFNNATLSYSSQLAEHLRLDAILDINGNSLDLDVSTTIAF